MERTEKDDFTSPRVQLRIPAMLTSKSADDDREERRGAWWLKCSVGGHHRVRVNRVSMYPASAFSVGDGGCTTAGQPGSPAGTWREVAGHGVPPV